MISSQHCDFNRPNIVMRVVRKATGESDEAYEAVIRPILEDCQDQGMLYHKTIVYSCNYKLSFSNNAIRYVQLYIQY